MPPTVDTRTKGHTHRTWNRVQGRPTSPAGTYEAHEAINPHHPLDGLDEEEEKRRQAEEMLLIVYSADEKQWDFVRLHWVEGLTITNTARRLGVTRNTVYKWRALAIETAERAREYVGAPRLLALLDSIIGTRGTTREGKRKQTAREPRRGPPKTETT